MPARVESGAASCHVHREDDTTRGSRTQTQPAAQRSSAIGAATPRPAVGWPSSSSASRAILPSSRCAGCAAAASSLALSDGPVRMTSSSMSRPSLAASRHRRRSPKGPRKRVALRSSEASSAPGPESAPSGAQQQQQQQQLRRSQSQQPPTAKPHSMQQVGRHAARQATTWRLHPLGSSPSSRVPSLPCGEVSARTRQPDTSSGTV
mmetsp:Transcript_9654/g.37583  ORF Transcript_9654/g.37583 Transcript_9654/m.37583 type:complete len:206 (+) Transcript_9654:73-690(+)